MTTSTTKKKYNRRSSNKKTNDKSVANYTWTPHQCDPTNINKYHYHTSFPIPTQATNEHLPITLNKQYSFKLPWKDSFVVICLHRNCRNTKWSTWYGRRPFYNFNKNHHRPTHDHQPCQIQIVSRLTMTKHCYIKEYRLVDYHKNVAPYPYATPTNYYVTQTQRETNLMNHIFNEFLGITICKRVLHAYYIREIIHWAAQQPQFKIQHNYLYRKSKHKFKISYDLKLVYGQMVRDQQFANSNHNQTQTTIIDTQSDEDGDMDMNNQSEPQIHEIAPTPIVSMPNNDNNS